jgi:cytochrome c oxidase subunit II
MLIPDASTSAQQVDLAFHRILGMALVLLVLVTAVMIFFVLKYRRGEKSVPENIEGSALLEITWTVIPTLLVLVMFYIGWTGFQSIRMVPKEVMTVKVVARQWSWLFSYGNGTQSDVLRLPVKRPVKLLLTAQDVIHCFSVPAFRIKEDCVPNMETYLSFTAELPGSYDIFCTEYCGLGHSGMVSKVIAMEEKDFDAWYAAAAPAGGKRPEGKSGGKILEEKGCLGCHTTDGTAKVGPTFKGMYGERMTVLTNGRERSITVNEEYLRRSILEPKADVAKGFPDIMPVIPVKPEELDVIVSYIKTLR